MTEAWHLHQNDPATDNAKQGRGRPDVSRAASHMGTTLIEAGFDVDSVRRWLGRKTLAMAIHYSATADTSDRMAQMIEQFDPLGSKQRT